MAKQLLNVSAVRFQVRMFCGAQHYHTALEDAPTRHPMADGWRAAVFFWLQLAFDVEGQSTMSHRLLDPAAKRTPDREVNIRRGDLLE